MAVVKGCFRKTCWKFSVSDAGNTLLGKLCFNFPKPKAPLTGKKKDRGIDGSKFCR